MAVSYIKLRKLLVEKNMSTADLRRATGLAPNTITKLRQDDEVSLSVLGKICALFQVNFCDIIDYVPDQPDCQ